MNNKFQILFFCLIFTLYSCLGKEKEVVEKTGDVEILDIDTTVNLYLINKEFGVHHADSFLTQNNPSLIDTLQSYSTKRIATKTGFTEQYALIYFHEFSEKFDCYLIFDDSDGEAGSYLFLTVNKKGFVIDYINYKDHEGFENGGIKIESTLTSKNTIKSIFKNSEKNVGENREYLNDWTNKIITTDYLISKEGKFVKESENQKISEHEPDRIDI